MFGVTSTPDPIRTAVLDLDLEPAAAGVLGRLLANHLGWAGRRADLAAALGVSPALLRIILAALEARGLVSQAKFNVDGVWCYPLAVTDTPGLLPTRDEMRSVYVDGAEVWDDANEAFNPTRRPTTSQFGHLSPTCDDATNAQVSTGAANPHVNRFPSRDAAPLGGRAASGTPVNRLSVPESSEVRAHGARSLVSSMAQLEALAKRPGPRPKDGGKWRTAAEVRDVGRTLDQDLVDDGLALLAGLGLAWHVAPEVWVLLERGWSPDRVAAELDGVHVGTRSPNGTARARLVRAAEDDARAEAAAAGAAAAGGTPLTAEDLVARDRSTAPSWAEAAQFADEADRHPEAAPWDRAAAEAVINRHRFGGFRARAVPEPTAYADLVEAQAAIRQEAGGDIPDEGTRVRSMAEIKAIAEAGRERFRASLAAHR